MVRWCTAKAGWHGATALLGLAALVGCGAAEGNQNNHLISVPINTGPPPAAPVDPDLRAELETAVLRPPIVEWPVVWNEERAWLASLYIERHKGWERTGNPELDTTMDPRVVVVHWTAGPSARSAWNTFRAPRQRGQRIQADWNAVNLTSHFIVDRDGTIFRILPETRMGRHTIGLNHIAIGIENVGNGSTLPMTEAQVEANAALVRWLAHEHALTHLIGHYEYRQMEQHPYFVETMHWFRTVRTDPGRDFMAALRERLDDLGLQGAPELPEALRRGSRSRRSSRAQR